MQAGDSWTTFTPPAEEQFHRYRGRFLHRRLYLAGGSEIGAAQFAAPFGGQLALEYVLKSDPRFYIATGLSATSGNQGLVIGFGVDKETASTSLAQVLQAEHCRHSGSGGATRFWAMEFL